MLTLLELISFIAFLTRWSGSRSVMRACRIWKPKCSIVYGERWC